ncbi:PDZ domain-containing protein [Azospirillum sp. B2RO_4]|uniref:PDZ domain-containing protein n=1 Tax=Azospirillum sp. B2RO_4 TaxID=3027796 RepID=UPI003DA8AEE4
MMAQTKPGDIARVVQRDGKPVTLAPITPELRKEFSLDSDVSGATVVEVAPDSPAAKAGFEPGDVITRAGQQTVGNPSDLANVVDLARKSGKDHVILLRRRDGQSLFVPLPLG